MILGGEALKQRMSFMRWGHSFHNVPWFWVDEPVFFPPGPLSFLPTPGFPQTLVPRSERGQRKPNSFRKKDPRFWIKFCPLIARAKQSSIIQWRVEIIFQIIQSVYHSKYLVKCKLFSRVWLSAAPWTVAHQASLSMGFSRQEYWCG